MRTNCFRFLFGLALCCLLCVCGGASAETRALLVGCDRFLSEENTAPSSANNVAEFAAVLRASAEPPSVLRSYVDGISSAEELGSAIRETFAGAGADDVSLLYLSTHGLWNQRWKPAETLFLLSNGEEEGGITAGELRAILDGIPGTKLLILDACHAGAVLGKGIYKPFDNVFQGADYKVLTSSGGAEESWFWSGEEGEEGMAAAGQGYFTAAICRALNPQDACPGDLNRDGRVTLAEMKRYLRAHHGESTVQVYPEEDDFCLYLRGTDVGEIRAGRVTDVSFETGALTVSQPEMVFGFTVRRWSRLAYRIVFRQDGRWDWADADFLYDTLETGPKPDDQPGWVSPGYKERRFVLTPDSEAGGYLLLQVLTLEDDGSLRVAASNVVCITPDAGDPDLNILLPDGFSPEDEEELTMVVQHRCPCELTVRVVDALGRVVRHLATLQATRPEQLYPDGSTFTWNGLDDQGQPVPAGWYRIDVRAGINGVYTSYLSRSVELRTKAYLPQLEPVPEDVLPRE